MTRKITVEFALEAPQAVSVGVAGTFNNWDATQTPMQKGSDGGWWVELPLPVGLHEYRFVVDGQWVSDPKAKDYVPNPHGGDNSVIEV